MCPEERAFVPEALTLRFHLLTPTTTHMQHYTDELLEQFLETFPEESAAVQLQLVTAAVKLFLKKPTERPQQMIQLVLTYATQVRKGNGNKLAITCFFLLVLGKWSSKGHQGEAQAGDGTPPTPNTLRVIRRLAPADPCTFLCKTLNRRRTTLTCATVRTSTGACCRPTPRRRKTWCCPSGR